MNLFVREITIYICLNCYAYIILAGRALVPDVSYKIGGAGCLMSELKTQNLALQLYLRCQKSLNNEVFDRR